MNWIFCNFKVNKVENVHRFTLSAIRGELLDREREKKRERLIKKIIINLTEIIFAP